MFPGDLYACMQLGGHYAAVKMNPIFEDDVIVDLDAKLVTDAFDTQEEVAQAIHNLAKGRAHMIYDDVLETNGPIVSIFKNKGNWVPIYIFPSAIAKASKESFEKLKTAERVGQMIAEKNDFLFLPEIGKSIAFKPRSHICNLNSLEL